MKPTPARPELVEGMSFLPTSHEKGQGFDRLSLSGSLTGDYC